MISVGDQGTDEETISVAAVIPDVTILSSDHLGSFLNYLLSKKTSFTNFY